MAGLTMSTSQTLVSSGGTCKFGIALRRTPLSNGVTTVLYGVNRLTYILVFFARITTVLHGSFVSWSAHDLNVYAALKKNEEYGPQAA